MIRVIATFQMKEDSLEKAIDMAKQLVSETRKEKGCIQYDLIQSDADSTRLVILEHWATQEDLDVHSASEHFTTIVPTLVALSAEAPKIETYKEIK